MSNWHGVRCIVTGAGSGIGRAFCEELLRAGATVGACDRDEGALASLVDLAERYGWECIALRADVTDERDLREVRDRFVTKTGGLDGWCNVAGIAETKAFQEQSSEMFDKVMQVNVGGVVYGTRVALETMEKQGSGFVVNVASVAGIVAAPFLSSYSTAKHAVVGFSRSLREELRLRDSPLRMVLVIPGFVSTPMLTKAGITFPEWLRWALATPEAVAKDMIKGLEQGAEEIVATENGRWMLRANRLFPRWTARRSRVLLARSFTDLLLRRFLVK